RERHRWAHLGHLVDGLRKRRPRQTHPGRHAAAAGTDATAGTKHVGVDEREGTTIHPPQLARPRCLARGLDYAQRPGRHESDSELRSENKTTYAVSRSRLTPRRAPGPPPASRSPEPPPIGPAISAAAPSLHTARRATRLPRRRSCPCHRRLARGTRAFLPATDRVLQTRMRFRCSARRSPLRGR